MRVIVIPDVHLKPWMFQRASELMKDNQIDRAVCLMDIPDDYAEHKVNQGLLYSAVIIRKIVEDEKDGKAYFDERHSTEQYLKTLFYDVPVLKYHLVSSILLSAAGGHFTYRFMNPQHPISENSEKPNDL